VNSIRSRTSRPVSYTHLLVQDIYQELVKSLHSDSADIKNLRSYAAVVTYHACAQLIRSRYPEYTRLKNRIRYFLTHTPEFGVWPAADGEVLCGYAGWRTSPLAKTEIVQALRLEPRRMEGSALPSKPLDGMGAADWKKLADGVFEFVQGPIELDDIVAIAGSLFGVKLEGTMPNAVSYTHLDVYKRQRLAFGMPALRIIQVTRTCLAFVLRPAAPRITRCGGDLQVGRLLRTYSGVAALSSRSVEESRGRRQWRPIDAFATACASAAMA